MMGLPHIKERDSSVSVLFLIIAYQAKDVTLLIIGQPWPGFDHLDQVLGHSTLGHT